MHGPHENQIARQCYMAGRPLPDSIKDAPELLPGLQFYLACYFDLDTERSHAFGPTPIPWSKILKYAEFLNLDEEELEEFFFFIKELDKDNLAKVEQRQKKEREKHGKKPSGTGRRLK